MHRRALLRASDQDREHVAERLRRAAVEGRLTSDELDERLGRAYAGRTYGELDELIADLPVPAALPARQGPVATMTPHLKSRPVAKVAGGTAFVLVLVALAALAHSGAVIGAHASRAAGGAVITHAFGMFAFARLAGAAVVGITFLLVLVAAIGWMLSRPWSTGGA